MDKLKASRKQYRRLFIKALNEQEETENNLNEDDKIVNLKLIEEKAKLMFAAKE